MRAVGPPHPWGSHSGGQPFSRDTEAVPLPMESGKSVTQRGPASGGATSRPPPRLLVTGPVSVLAKAPLGPRPLPQPGRPVASRLSQWPSLYSDRQGESSSSRERPASLPFRVAMSRAHVAGGKRRHQTAIRTRDQAQNRVLPEKRCLLGN